MDKKIIDITRGKPNHEQLDLSNKMFDSINCSDSFNSEENFDIRNYGCLTGLHECKALFKDLLGVSEDNMIVFGNSSLNIMFSLVSNAMTHGICGSKPWSKYEKIKWLCPVPGYDRHFAITEYFGIEMINIPMNSDGPDMDMIEEMTQHDETIKGIWCVPTYSNPTGITYSDEVVKRFARLKPKAKDFRIFWDNAYGIHHIYKEKRDRLLNIFEEAKKVNNEDIVYLFASTSKITFSGAGLAFFGASANNIEQIKKFMSISTIGYDKINQLRHVNFFKGDINNVYKHMEMQSDIIRPKFELVEKMFKENISKYASWSSPLGGYFVSLYVDNKAKEIIEKCKEKGLLLTPAGSAFPYHVDANNSHIRIAPTYLSLKDLEDALTILVNVIKEI